jgi:hypothetical protein
VFQENGLLGLLCANRRHSALQNNSEVSSSKSTSLTREVLCLAVKFSMKPEWDHMRCYRPSDLRKCFRV